MIIPSQKPTFCLLLPNILHHTSQSTVPAFGSHIFLELTYPLSHGVRGERRNSDRTQAASASTDDQENDDDHKVLSFIKEVVGTSPTRGKRRRWVPWWGPEALAGDMQRELGYRVYLVGYEGGRGEERKAEAASPEVGQGKERQIMGGWKRGGISACPS